jgi:hypothetical protein
MGNQAAGRASAHSDYQAAAIQLQLQSERTVRASNRLMGALVRSAVQSEDE